MTLSYSDCRLCPVLQGARRLSTPSSFLTESMIQQAIGAKSHPINTVIEKGAIRRFAEAIGDSNPLYIDEVVARSSIHGGIIAPPTFLRSAGTVRPEIPFEIPFDRLLDGGSSWEYHSDIRAGDIITAVGTVTDMSERSGRVGLMIFITTEIRYTNQFEELVATQVNTTIRY